MEKKTILELLVMAFKNKGSLHREAIAELEKRVAEESDANDNESESGVVS